MNEQQVNSAATGEYALWNTLAPKLAVASGLIGLFIIFVYVIRLNLVSGSKNKYNFISKNEIRYLFIGTIFMVVGVLFYANSNIVEHLNYLTGFMRLFLSLSGGIVTIIVIQSFLKFYYPFFVEKRLKALRYKPRISPKTGNPMKLLSEEEEDAYLDEGMQAEEDVFSVDYDVWKDEETGFVQIEKYSGHLHALECPNCKYQTLKLSREEILKKPTPQAEGELLKHFQCSYCSHRIKKWVPLKQLQSASDKKETITGSSKA